MVILPVLREGSDQGFSWQWAQEGTPIRGLIAQPSLKTEKKRTRN
jgi:hypothetical protein